MYVYIYIYMYIYIYIYIYIYMRFVKQILCFLFFVTLSQHIHTPVTLVSHSHNLSQLLLLDHCQ